MTMATLPRRTGACAILLGLLLGAPPAMAAEKAPAPPAERIKITIPATALTFAPLFLAKGIGFFAEEGLDAEVVDAPGARSIQAVLSRDADFSVAPGTYQISAHAQGQRVLSVASLLTRNSINVVMHKAVAAERGITERTPLAEKLKALRGLKMSGVAPGSFSYQVLVYYILQAGLDPKTDVSLIGVGAGGTLLAALEQRQIDVFATGVPIPDAAVHRGFGVMLVNNAMGEDPAFQEFMMNVLLVRPETAQQKPDLVRRATRALVRANRWIREHKPEEGLPHVRASVPLLDPPVIEAALRAIWHGVPPDGRVTERAVELTQDFMLKVGAVKEKAPYAALVSNDFLPK
jgi:NitT/TauT family transport system substrate-binding protein